MKPLIEVRDLDKSYGAFKVLKNVSFDVGEGESFVIIGPNGAGKTTLFRSLTGEAKVNAGRITFAGENVTEVAAHDRVRKGMARTFQVARVFFEFTALENLVAAIEARGDYLRRGRKSWFGVAPRREIVEEAQARLEDMGLGDKRFVEARSLSHGDKKKLEFALALASQPRVLMLDEPTAGMSPAERQQTVALLRRIREDHGMTIVLTEHDMDVVFGLADRIMVLNYGEVVATGDPAAVRADPHVKQIYLGHEASHV